MFLYINKKICFTENSNEVLVATGVSWMLHNFIFSVHWSKLWNYIPLNIYMDYFALPKHLFYNPASIRNKTKLQKVKTKGDQQVKNNLRWNHCDQAVFVRYVCIYIYTHTHILNFEELVLCDGPLPSLTSSESFQNGGPELAALWASFPHLPPSPRTSTFSSRKPILLSKSSSNSNVYQNVLAKLGVLIKEPEGVRGSDGALQGGGQVTDQPHVPLCCTAAADGERGGRKAKASFNLSSSWYKACKNICLYRFERKKVPFA